MSGTTPNPPATGRTVTRFDFGNGFPSIDVEIDHEALAALLARLMNRRRKHGRERTRVTSLYGAIVARRVVK